MYFIMLQISEIFKIDGLLGKLQNIDILRIAFLEGNALYTKTAQHSYCGQAAVCMVGWYLDNEEGTFEIIDCPAIINNALLHIVLIL